MFNKLTDIIEKVKVIENENDYNIVLHEIKGLIHVNEAQVLTLQDN